MSDHYIAHLERSNRALHDRLDAARDEAAVLTIVLTAVLGAHEGCTAQTCTTLAAIEAVAG